MWLVVTHRGSSFIEDWDPAVQKQRNVTQTIEFVALTQLESCMWKSVESDTVQDQKSE
jgi:hypothetical protein